jgi:hypothetical protein
MLRSLTLTLSMADPVDGHGHRRSRDGPAWRFAITQRPVP